MAHEILRENPVDDRLDTCSPLTSSTPAKKEFADIRTVNSLSSTVSTSNNPGTMADSIY